MKKNTFVFVLILIFIPLFSAFSQTEDEKIKITQDYDVEKLEKLTESFIATEIQNKKEVEAYAKEHNIPIKIEKNGVLKELIKISKEGNLIYLKTYNDDAAVSTRANTLHNGGILGLDIEGQGMTAYVWDGGVARPTHQEYDGIGGNNRYTIGDTGSPNFHAAHVTGTIMASGVQAASKGMAPQANVIGYDWSSDISEMSTRAANGMLLSNHSYGDDEEAIPDWYFGAYNSRSRNIDLLMRSAPYYLMVGAAGNGGNDSSSNANPLNGNSSYDKLSSFYTAKNNLVVANAQDANVDANGNLISVTINSGSSQGPTDDLRIKPDIAGNGTQLYSTYEDSDTSYNTISGTSMASPNVTGTLLLLQQYYNNLNSNFMRAPTLKGLALHTADDAGSNGPDAIFGWGLLNAKDAVNAITTNGTNSMINELTLNPGQEYTVGIRSDDISELKVSICWNDPAGNPNTGTINDTTPVLVNDLDVRVTQGTNTYMPYRLNSITTNSKADNTVDPFERIDVPSANGIYTIKVTHKGSLFGGSQNYSLIVTGVQYNGACNAIAPTNQNAETILFGSTTLTWDVVIGTTYEVRYREIGSSTWITETTTNPSVVIGGLIGIKSYEYQVKSICGDGSESTFSSSYNFGATAGIDDIKLTKFRIIDSSNSNEIIISNEFENIIKQVQIHDVLGRQIITKDANDNEILLKSDNLISGSIYFVRVNYQSNSFRTMKFIKK